MHLQSLAACPLYRVSSYLLEYFVVKTSNEVDINDTLVNEMCCPPKLPYINSFWKLLLVLMGSTEYYKTNSVNGRRASNNY